MTIRTGMHRILACVITTILTMSVYNTTFATEYNVQRLDHLGDGGNVVRDINEKGTTTGSSRGDSGGEFVDNAVIWDSTGAVTNIDNNGQSFYTFGHALNNNGDVVGRFDDVFPNLWTGGQSIRLLSPEGLSVRGSANDIDDRGLIVGCSHSGRLAASSSLPVIWDNDPLAQIIPGTPQDATGCAREINSVGHITGALTLNGMTKAVIWRDGGLVELAIPANFNRCEANAINDLDHVVGFCVSSISGTARAYLWQDGDAIDLGTLNNDGSGIGIAYDINNSDEILGFAGGPFVWRNGSMQDLSAVIRPIRYQAINDAGQIVGNTYILTPVATSSAPLSEPASETESTPTVITDLPQAELAEADLSVSVQDSPNPARRRRTLTYTLTVQNSGPAMATDVELSNELSPYVKFKSIMVSQGQCRGERNIRCQLGDLASGETVSVEIKVSPKKRKTLKNKTVVSSSSNDANSDNNSVTTKTPVKR